MDVLRWPHHRDNLLAGQFKPTAELRREGRLTRIAKALASGATVTDISEAEGIGRTFGLQALRSSHSRACFGVSC